MKNNTKLAVIGGTGKSGKYLVSQLLRQGFSFKLLLRNPTLFTLKSALIEVVQGDVRDADAIRLLVKDCHAIISTLGQPRGEPSIFSQATKNVILAMEEYQLKRYILTTGLNVDAAEDQKSAKTKFATDWMKSNYPETTYDKQLEFDMLTNSDLDWTLVRLPLIEQTEQSSNTLVSLEDCPGDKISATDLALFLIGQLSDDSFIKKAPFVANG